MNSTKKSETTIMLVIEAATQVMLEDVNVEALEARLEASNQSLSAPSDPQVHQVEAISEAIQNEVVFEADVGDSTAETRQKWPLKYSLIV